MNTRVDLSRYHRLLEQIPPIRLQGRVVQVVGLSTEVEGLRLQIGELCRIYPDRGSGRFIPAEVVGFREGRLVLMPFGEMRGIKPGALVCASGRLFTTPVGEELLGRVVDGLGRPLDGQGPLGCRQRHPIGDASPNPMTRARISSPLETGIRAIDGLLTCGRGQRIGIFSGSGVGKSTLIGMLARHIRSQVKVIALIGERGREVQDFIQLSLGQEGLARSVVVVSTSDQPPLLRIKGAWVATAIAEHFRNQGRDVVFLLDSVTRLAMAQREVGLAIGEPPATKGYTPSVFALLPKLMERTGTSDKGTITGFYSVLVEADDMTEPITDTVRSILDGHIHLSRDLANANHYPAIDILGSVSRVMPTVTAADHQEVAKQLRDLVAAYRNARDLIDIGAYVAGSNPQIDRALRLMPRINAFLQQRPDEFSPFAQTIAQLRAIFAEGGSLNGT